MPQGRALAHGLPRRLLLGAAIALAVGAAQANPQGEVGSAAETEAQRQPMLIEWGTPLNTTAAAPAAAVEQSEPRRRLDELRHGAWGATPRQSGGSLLLSRSRLEAEAEHHEPGQPLVGAEAPSVSLQRASVDVNNIAYRWWFGNSSQSVALGVGAATYQVRLGSDVAHGSGMQTTMGAPLVSLGLRQRMSESSLLYLDAASARQLRANDPSDYYGARAGVEWQASRNSTFAVEQGKIRVRLYSGPNSQMLLRVRKGGPMLIYRRSFD